MEQVGRYKILEELGRGAHGVVYKALDPAIGRTIAIKAIALGNINVADRERVREGILREAKLAGTLSHPNIVTVYDVLDGDDSAYIVMEFVDGKSLEDAIAAIKNKRADKLSREGFFSVFKQLAQALDYAHRKGVIHRDVKPANILLTDQRSGRESSENELLAKIADFGVAKFVSQEATQQLGGRPALIGTPSYMSPEQVQGVVVSGASDQFSLAVIGYEVLCGRKPFLADTVEALLYRIRNDREQLAHLANTALSMTVSKVLNRALSKNPNERFTSCSEFAGALEFALGDSSSWEPGVIGSAADNSDRALVKYRPPEEEPEEEPQWGKKLALIGGLILAVGLAIVMIVRMNSGPALPTQVLDTKNGSVSAPPTVEELPYDKHVTTTPPLELNQAQKPPLKAAIDNAPTVVNVPVPARASALASKIAKTLSKKKAAAIRPVRLAAVSGDVQLVSDPPGVSVMVDGMSACTTPCSIALASGRHTLAANMEGYGVFRKIFHVPADTSILLPMVKNLGVLLVSSEPAGESVNLDGRQVGTTPITLRLAPGGHRVAVWDGTKWHEESVQIAADEVHTRMFHF